MASPFDPKKVIVIFDGIIVTGYMGGTFINTARNVESATESVGAGGDVTVVRSQNKTGTSTLTLQAESPTNRLLSAKLLQFEEFGRGIGPFLVKNLLGDTLASDASSWIKKYADIEYADDASGREWVFGHESLNMLVGGANG